MEDPEFMRTVMLPITVAKGKIPGMKRITTIYVRALNWDVVPELQAQVGAVIKRNQPGYAKSMLVIYHADRIASLKAIAFLFKFFLISSIVVTLLLGSLGITNVMLAVVRERTTEIGLRKAVGATNGIILLHFLCEALTVSLMGAIGGIIMGVAAVEVLERILETTSDTRTLMLSLLGSVGIGILLGVVSGVLPARRAGSLDPVDAMRFE
jgi:putative ABC transport system permease protein